MVNHYLVINLDGLFISSFIIDLALALLGTFLLRLTLQRMRLWRFFANPPLAQFAIMICLLGLFTILL